ncbi:alpha/beta fold hydrolase [Mycobacterium branderi]|uniref:Alpha/beta hydrolase n=1 Tax=Mycobacterium branderi TaxID=43348 RepID=A0A7I7VYP8_9MYCO|nr:alpha/beta hydrolase [Mycobacterium branderi]MCV7233380.1 alpha/beta hydrolase [Mycobacterium branderi]ORA41437.1 alpha/beta hydrolase [Mycobacterium branderi]BBZ10494.1 alpha/beta hydrolase [Mycobacterium branderi]
MQVRKGTARSADVDLYYEDMGDPNDPAVLLIMGLGAQLLLWRTAFCEKLVAEGYRVIRYDNRDVGLSTKTERVKSGPKLPRMIRFWLGLPGNAPYRLEDMADDAVAVLDHLGIERAHVVGASMGGMIAQIVAARYSARTRSLAVIFSSNNRRFLPPPAPRALFAVIQGPPPNSPRDVIVDNAVRVTRIIGSPAYPAPEQRIREEAIEGYERSYFPWGIARHFNAVLASGSLVRYDRQITAPTVVIHGLADKLMRPSGGRAVARAIRGARLVTFDGMGHELPEQLWDPVIGELTKTFAEG